MEKKIIKNELEENIIYNLEGDILDAIKCLQEIYDSNKNDYDSIKIDYDYDTDYKIINVYGYRLETDKEYNDRIYHDRMDFESKKIHAIKTIKGLKNKYNLDIKIKED